MEGSGTTSGSSEQSLVGVLPEVVKGLRDKPPLLFGIGAGIVLVAVLGATTNVWLVLIVAAVLVISLAAWVWSDALKRRDEAVTRADVRNVTTSPRAKISEGADVGVVDAGSGSVENVTDVTDAEITGSNVGVVREGGSRRRRTRS
jgi:HAMP domain-containing protein